MCKIGAFRQVCKAHFDESAGTRIPDIKVVQLRRMTDWNGEVMGFANKKYVALDNVILEKDYPYGTFKQDIEIGTKGLDDYKIIEDYEKEILELKGFNDKKFDNLCDIYRKYNILNDRYGKYTSSYYKYKEIEKLNEEKERKQRVKTKEQNDENLLDALFSKKNGEREM